MTIKLFALLLVVGIEALSVGLAADRAVSRSARTGEKTTAAVVAGFAPLPAGHPLAPLWNDPEFSRRLYGSYGFASDVEPRLTPEEQAAYREKVLPVLAENPKQAITILEGLATPTACAVFDFTLGTLLFQAEEYAKAVEHLEAAIAKHPDFRRAHKNLAFAKVRQGAYAAAIAPLTKTIALGGGDGRVYGLLGFACLDQGRFTAAEAAYRQALVFEPENSEFRLGLVKCSAAAGNVDYALALLEELLKENPTRENLWSLQANLFVQRDQPLQAAMSLEILHRLGKATPQNLYLLGDLYMTQEVRDLALQAYLQAVEADGMKNPARALRPAQILASRGAWDEAKALIGKLRASGAVFAAADEALLHRLEAKGFLARGDLDAAISALEPLLAKNPLDAEAILLAGDCHAKKGDREKAAFRYEMAAKIVGHEADAFLKHAQLLVQAQRYPQAIELLRKAQKAKPRDAVQRYLERVEQVARGARS